MINFYSNMSQHIDLSDEDQGIGNKNGFFHETVSVLIECD